MSFPMTPDVIDLLAGIEPGSHLHQLRSERQRARDNAQASYLALFEPADPRTVSVAERFAIASFVLGLNGRTEETRYYMAKLAGNVGGAALAAAITAELPRGMASGPVGRYPKGPLSGEDVAGVAYHVSDDCKAVVGSRIAAAMEHAHLLTFRPRDADPCALQSLLDAGWSTDGIVTLSQLIAFLAFQLRVILGLKALASAPATAA
jgi:CMD domain protein